MPKKTALVLIFFIATAGVLFSGYLSYRELFAESCNLNWIKCGTTVQGLPACVYGLLMYTCILIISGLGIIDGKKR